MRDQRRHLGEQCAAERRGELGRIEPECLADVIDDSGPQRSPPCEPGIVQLDGAGERDDRGIGGAIERPCPRGRGISTRRLVGAERGLHRQRLLVFVPCRAVARPIDSSN